MESICFDNFFLLGVQLININLLYLQKYTMLPPVADSLISVNLNSTVVKNMNFGVKSQIYWLLLLE